MGMLQSRVKVVLIVGVREFASHLNSLPCNMHRVTFENVKRLFGQSEAEKLGQVWQKISNMASGKLDLW